MGGFYSSDVAGLSARAWATATSGCRACSALASAISGWGPLVTGLYAGFLLGGLGSVLLVLARRVTVKTHIPFGPFMMVGALDRADLGADAGALVPVPVSRARA